MILELLYINGDVGSQCKCRKEENILQELQHSLEENQKEIQGSYRQFKTRGVAETRSIASGKKIERRYSKT
jgi:hypothetical protein